MTSNHVEVRVTRTLAGATYTARHIDGREVIIRNSSETYRESDFVTINGHEYRITCIYNFARAEQFIRDFFHCPERGGLSIAWKGYIPNDCVS